MSVFLIGLIFFILSIIIMVNIPEVWESKDDDKILLKIFIAMFLMGSGIFMLIQ